MPQLNDKILAAATSIHSNETYDPSGKAWEIWEALSSKEKIRIGQKEISRLIKREMSKLGRSSKDKEYNRQFELPLR